jgi:ketosteroid isomerase-like protein
VADATAERVRETYRLLRRGDPRELPELLHDDVVWRQADGRTVSGPLEVAKALLWTAAMHRVRVGEVLGVGDRAVVTLTGRRMGRLGASGLLARKIFQVVVVRDGKIAGIEDYGDRAEAFAAVGLTG